MEYVLVKLLLPVLVPILTAVLKQVIDKFTPLVLDRVPKLAWTTVAMVAGGLPPLLSPDFFVLPGIPSGASVALYGLASMGLREVVDQVLKVVGPPPTSPTGM